MGGNFAGGNFPEGEFPRTIYTLYIIHMIYDLMYINYSKNIIEIFKYRDNKYPYLYVNRETCKEKSCCPTP